MDITCSIERTHRVILIESGVEGSYHAFSVTTESAQAQHCYEINYNNHFCRAIAFISMFHKIINKTVDLQVSASPYLQTAHTTTNFTYHNCHKYTSSPRTIRQWKYASELHDNTKHVIMTSR